MCENLKKDSATFAENFHTVIHLESPITTREKWRVGEDHTILLHLEQIENVKVHHVLDQNSYTKSSGNCMY